jgi:methionyl-tRNA formyltransferase
MNTNNPRTAVVFTSAAAAVDASARSFDVVQVVCERARLTHALSDAAGELRADLLLTDNRDAIEVPGALATADVGIVFGFGVIFRPITIDEFPAGIWNVHAGDLPNYRGRHAITWAILEGALEIGITVHRIDETIDRGHALYRTTVPRYLGDGYEKVVERVHGALPDAVAGARANFEAGIAEPIGPGRYFPRIDRTFTDVNPACIDAPKLFRLVSNERAFGGVKVCGRRCMRCHFRRDELPRRSDWVVRCRDGVELELFEDD